MPHGSQIVGFEGHAVGIGVRPVDQEEVLPAISYVIVVVARLGEAFGARKSTCGIRILDEVGNVAVQHLLVVSVVQAHGELVVDVQVRGVLPQPKAAGGSGRQGY